MIHFPYGRTGSAGRIEDHAHWREPLAQLDAVLAGGCYRQLAEPGRPPGALCEDARLGQAALVIPTSGSTGDAKYVILSADALQAAVAATSQRIGTGNWLLALPPHRIAGLQVLLRARLTGGTVVALNAAESFSALTFAAACALLPEPRYVSVVPTQLHRLLLEPASSELLRSFSAVLLGGAPASPELLDRASSAGVRVVRTYGMTETCGGCVYDGYPLPGVSVALQQDRICLTGPMVAIGYVGRPQDPAFSEPGTFCSADLGRCVDGRLEVLGRADEVIITGGVKVHPQQIEVVLAGLDGVESTVVCGIPDQEWGQRVVAVLTGTIPPPDILSAALSELGPAYQVRRVLRYPSAIPHLAPGKPDRRAVAAWAHRTELHSAARGD